MFTVMFFDANRIDMIKEKFTKTIEKETGTGEKHRKLSESLTGGSGETKTTNLPKNKSTTGKLVELSTINETEMS